MGTESCLRMGTLIRESHEERERRWKSEELTYCSCLFPISAALIKAHDTESVSDMLVSMCARGYALSCM